jgi:hypothetical protein
VHGVLREDDDPAPGEPEVPDGHPAREDLELLDHHGRHGLGGGEGLGVDDLEEVAVVGADEEDVEAGAGRRLHGGVHSDLREPVLEREARTRSGCPKEAGTASSISVCMKLSVESDSSPESSAHHGLIPRPSNVGTSSSSSDEG